MSRSGLAGPIGAPWPTRPLAELAEAFSDGDWIESKDQSPSGIRLLQTGNVGEGEFKDRAERARFISTDTFVRLNCTEVFAGDILVSRLPDPVGRACLVPESNARMITAVDCSIVRLDERLIFPEFFVYFTQSEAYLSAVATLCTGTTRSRISRSALGRIGIPTPPLDEQKRIVAALDQAFAALDRARANAEANLADAQLALSESRETLLDPGQPGWSQRPLSDLVDIKHGYAFQSEFFASEGEHILLTPGNFHETGGFRHRGERQKFYSGPVPEEFVLDEGDLLIAMTEQAPGLLGSCILVPEGGRYLHNQRLGLIVPKANSDWHAPYFAHVSNLKAFRRALSDTCTGLKVRHTSPSRILSVEVPMPRSINEQREVSLLLDELTNNASRVADAYQKKLEDIGALRQSLLQAAFSGQLS